MRLLSAGFLVAAAGCGPAVDPPQGGDSATETGSSSGSSDGGSTSADPTTPTSSSTTPSSSSGNESDGSTDASSSSGAPPPEGGLGPWGFGFVELGFDIRDVVLADFDGDAHLDLFTSRAGMYELHRGSGDGQLASDASGELGNWDRLLLAADVDGDDDLDVAAFDPDYADRFFVAFNDGTGAFAPALRVDLDDSTFNFDVAVIDVDGDGNDDFITGLGHSEGGTVLRSQGDGTVVSMPHPDLVPACYVSNIAVADFDGDDWSDVAVTGSCNDVPAALPIALFAGSDSGLQESVSYFEGGAVLEGCDVVPVDFDGDGDLDIVTGAPSALSVLRGDGAGDLAAPETMLHGFEHYTQRVLPMELTAGALVGFVLEARDYVDGVQVPLAAVVEQSDQDLATTDLDLGGWVIDVGDFDEDGRNDLLVRAGDGEMGAAQLWLSGG